MPVTGVLMLCSWPTKGDLVPVSANELGPSSDTAPEKVLALMILLKQRATVEQRSWLESLSSEEQESVADLAQSWGVERVLASLPLLQDQLAYVRGM